MTAVVQAEGLGKRYGSTWALKDCSFRLSPGQVTALVGPNGSGKSTLLETAVGLLSPSEGAIEVVGGSPTMEPEKVLARVGFVAQEHPLYSGFSVAETLRLGSELNPRWDSDFARRRIGQLGLPLKKKIGQLSGGQRAQMALVLALAKRPKLLLLDEPIAAFDPLARREFLQVLMETVAESGATVLLSSHILGDLERVCDSLMLLFAGRLQLSGEIEHILASHRLVVGPLSGRLMASWAQGVIHRTRTEKQMATLVRMNEPLILGEAWSVYEPSLEDIILGYLQRGDAAFAPEEEREIGMIWLGWRQSRLELLFGLALLAGIAAFLIPTGMQKLAQFDDSGLAAALSSGSADTAELAQSFLKSYDSLNAIVAYSTLIVVIMGVALAAPIVLDFERGTHRLVWTQSITRRRWLATKIGIALLGVLVFSLVLTLLLTWWFIPQDRVQDPFGQDFNLKGFVPFAYAVFGLALALALGALTRRTVLAAIVAIVVFVPVWGVVQDVLRPHYLAPIEQTTALSEALPTVPERAWVVDDFYIDKEGNRLTKQQLPNEIGRSELQGLRNVVVYHPADRFWTFQAIEAAIFLGVAALLLGLTFWVVERRMR